MGRGSNPTRILNCFQVSLWQILGGGDWYNIPNPCTSNPNHFDKYMYQDNRQMNRLMWYPAGFRFTHSKHRRKWYQRQNSTWPLILTFRVSEIITKQGGLADLGVPGQGRLALSGWSHNKTKHVCAFVFLWISCSICHRENSLEATSSKIYARYQWYQLGADTTPLDYRVYQNCKEF
jgi:hypothetical protein